MNQYSEILIYLKSLLESDDLVNTVTKEDVREIIDHEKQNIYPLCHIDIDSAGFTNGKTVTFSIEVAALDIRDFNNEPNKDKFWDNDNEVDNHNTTFAILNNLWTRLYKDVEDRDITASENPQLNKVTLEHTNQLDGWLLSFDLEVPNDVLNLCQ